MIIALCIIAACYLIVGCVLVCRFEIFGQGDPSYGMHNVIAMVILILVWLPLVIFDAVQRWRKSGGGTDTEKA